MKFDLSKFKIIKLFACKDQSGNAVSDPFIVNINRDINVKVEEWKKKEEEALRESMSTKEKALKTLKDGTWARDNYLSYSPDELKDDEDVIIAAIKKCPTEIRFVKNDIKNDLNFLSKLLKQMELPPSVVNGIILRSLDRRLRSRINKYYWNGHLSLCDSVKMVLEIENLKNNIQERNNINRPGAKRL